MARKRTYAELSATVERNLKGIMTNMGMKKGLANDLVEIYEDVVRMQRDLSVIVRPKAAKEDIKKALLSMMAWSWHTADHLNSVHQILSEDW